MKEPCQLCKKPANLKKAILKSWGFEGWKEEVLNMCDFCIKDENAKVVVEKEKERAA